jgi:transposase
LLRLLDELDPQIRELDTAAEAEARRHPDVVLLMEQKGVGPVVGLAFVLTLGTVRRFPRSRQVVSYLGLKRHNFHHCQSRNGASCVNSNALAAILEGNASKTVFPQPESPRPSARLQIVALISAPWHKLYWSWHLSRLS